MTTVNDMSMVMGQLTGGQMQLSLVLARFIVTSGKWQTTADRGNFIITSENCRADLRVKTTETLPEMDLQVGWQVWLGAVGYLLLVKVTSIW